ncbi:hypothetical protein Q5752_005125 [Cryptotrichosporon argae]
MPDLACQRERDDLAACLLRSDCVIKHNKTPQQCLRNPVQLPLQCQHLLTSFADCKKGMLDMRRRFRGNHLSTKEQQSERGSGVVGIADIGPEGQNGR